MSFLTNQEALELSKDLEFITTRHSSKMKGGKDGDS